MKSRERLLSRLGVSLNVTVTSIPPTHSENSEMLFSDHLKTESSDGEINKDENVKDEHWLPVESDTDETDLPAYNELSEKDIAQNMDKSVNIKLEQNITSNQIESLCSDDADDEPLSKMSRMTEETKLPKKKGPKFDDSCFENFTTVTLLTPEEARKEVELRKETSNYKNCPFKCDLCYRGFEAQKAYGNHMKKHSSVSIVSFTLPLCCLLN